MCGRYASTRSAADLTALFEALDETDGELAVDYNVAPTDPVPIVRRSTRVEQPVLSVARWGLIPAWSTHASDAARMINARAETVATSRPFGASFARRRCLVPAEGWYEWLRQGQGQGQGRQRQRQPYFMTRGDGAVLTFGGVWSAWTGPSGRLLTFSIITLPAEGHLAQVHDRMPLVLEPRHWEAWLGAADGADLLRPPSASYRAGIALRPVSAAVGDVRNDGPELIREVVGPTKPSTVESSEPTLF